MPTVDPQALDTQAIGRPRLLVTALLILAAGAATAYAFVVGRPLAKAHYEIKLDAAPFVGMWKWRIGPRLLLSVAVAAVAVAVLPAAAQRIRCRWLVVMCAAFNALFAFVLAASDGWRAVIGPVVDPTEYWVGVKLADPFSLFLRTFARQGLYFTVHVRGHPPGMMLLLIMMRPLGLHSPWAAAALSFIGCGATVVAVSVTVWRLVGIEAARRAALLLAIAPFAVWQGTSADAFYCGVASSAIALAAVAATSEGARSQISGFGSGVIMAGAAFLTYGAITLAPIFVTMVLITRTWRWLPAFALGGSVVVGTFLWGGFWWLEGFRATQHHYWEGTAKFRPPVYFAIANLVVLSFAIGLPTLASLPNAVLRRTKLSALIISALVCVAIAEASQYSKGETERIWLIYMPWLVISGVAVAGTKNRQRWWITTQAATAIVLQAALVSKW